MHRFDLALLVLRVVFGLTMAYHGSNKFFGAGGLAGTTGWFGSIGMKWPKLQARLAATTEVGAGVLLAVGLFTPLAAAGMIGLMVVAIVVAHWKNGFFIFKQGQGWEYCMSIAVASWAIGAMGAGEWSLDHAFDIEWTAWDGWIGAVVAGVLGVGGGLAQLAISYRPAKATS